MAETQPFLLVTPAMRLGVPAERGRLLGAARERSTDSTVDLTLGERESVAPTSASDWDDAPNIHDVRSLHSQLRANDSPVELPLRSRAMTYVVAVILVAGLVAVCVCIFLMASSRTF
jgi:hypothetical protein